MLRNVLLGHSRSFSRLASAASADGLPKFYIVDTTLREGEQFATTEFTRQDRVYIAHVLDKIGVDYIELVNPAASMQAVRDCEAIARLNLKSKILTHTRCNMSDVKTAVETGVQGVNLYMATSSLLRQHSHGKGIDAIIDIASEVIKYVKSHGLEVRFSCEDTFRSDKTDLLRIYGVRRSWRLAVQPLFSSFVSFLSRRRSTSWAWIEWDWPTRWVWPHPSRCTTRSRPCATSSSPPRASSSTRTTTLAAALPTHTSPSRLVRPTLTHVSLALAR